MPSWTAMTNRIFNPMHPLDMGVMVEKRRGNCTNTILPVHINDINVDGETSALGARVSLQRQPRNKQQLYVNSYCEVPQPHRVRGNTVACDSRCHRVEPFFFLAHLPNWIDWDIYPPTQKSGGNFLDTSCLCQLWYTISQQDTVSICLLGYCGHAS